jgi:hypothetical protein
MVTALFAVRDYCDDLTDQPWITVEKLLTRALQLVDKDQRRAENSTKFDGAYYDPAIDDDRLDRQIGRVFAVMADGRWHRLSGIAAATGDSEPSVSAQLRHLRKAKHGSWIIDVKRVNGPGGLFAYRMRNPDGTRLPPVQPLRSERS